jgi:hypothetical protein
MTDSTDLIFFVSDAFDSPIFASGHTVSPSDMPLHSLWASISRTLGLERKTKKKVGKAVKVNYLD